MKGGHIRIHKLSLRSSSSSTNIYKIVETSGSFSEESGGTSNHLFGQYSSDGVHSNLAKIAHIPHIPCAHSSGVHSKHSQVRTGASTVTRLPWVPDRLEIHDHCPPREQGAKDSEGVSTYVQPADGHSSTTCSSDWINDGMLTCHCSSSSSLPRSPESSIHSLTSLHDQLQQSNTPVSGSKSRSQLVDQPLHCSYMSSHSTSNGVPDIADRCFNHRLGSLLSGNKSNDRQSMVRARSCSPHQLVRAESSISGSAVLCQARQLPHPVTHGQHSCHILHQPERGNPLSQVVSASVGPVELVHGSQHNIACRAFTRDSMSLPTSSPDT